MELCVSAGVIVYQIIDSEPYYLLLRHTAGHWDFPKGKVEQSESLLQAAVRELTEEAGITATIIPGFEQSVQYQYRYRGVLVDKRVHFFLGIADTSDIILSSEHTDGGWFCYHDALIRLTYETSRHILKIAHVQVVKS